MLLLQTCMVSLKLQGDRYCINSFPKDVSGFLSCSELSFDLCNSRGTLKIMFNWSRKQSLFLETTKMWFQVKAGLWSYVFSPKKLHPAEIWPLSC